MKLRRITVHNFKGIRDFTLEPNGKDISVKGANATGKTTLADAFWWVLFGKSSSGQTDFEILPLDTDGHRVKGITEASVECLLAYDGGGIHDGKQVTLRKVFSEVWRKRRGKSEAEFSGHETTYFIDGVPTKAGEYQAFIKGMCDEDKFKLITNARYFNEILDWKARRKVILGLGAEIPDSEVISADKDLADLASVLNGRTVDDFRKVLDAELKKTNQELDKLPVRIDEANKSLPPDEMLHRDITVDIESLRKDRQAKQAQLSSLETTGAAEKVKALREIEGEITNLDNQHRQGIGKQISEAQGAVDQVTSEVRRLVRDLLSFQSDIDQQDARIKAFSQLIQELAGEWEKATAETFQHADIATCYACQQPLPEDQVKAAHDKAEAAFNLAKSQRIERIERDGNSAKGLKEGAEKAKAQAVAAKEVTRKALADTNAKPPDLQAKVTDLKAQQSQPSNDPKRHQLADQVIALREELEQLKGGAVNPAKEKLTSEVKELDGQIASAERAKATADQRAKGLLRIDELKAQQKQLGKDFERLEHQRVLCEKFVVSKARTLNQRIDGMFKLAHFRMYETQINGGINDQMCEVMVNGVPYSDLNNGMRICVGIDIANTLSEAWDVSAPMWVDNSEAVVDLLPSRGQQIRLYVSATDPVLRVETGEKILAEV